MEVTISIWIVLLIVLLDIIAVVGVTYFVTRSANREIPPRPDEPGGQYHCCGE